MADQIFMLICEDASNLGGPMGTEYTTHVFTKPFKSVDAAKAYAHQYQRGTWPQHAQWVKERDGRIHCDSGAYIWNIKPEEVGG